jgi:hypothetical protein
MANPEKADEMFEKLWPDAVAIGDPKQVLYREFGVSTGSILQFFKPGIWKAFFRARKFGVGMPAGNTMRKPGAFLIVDSQIRYAQEFEHFGVLVDEHAVQRAALEL